MNIENELLKFDKSLTEGMQKYIDLDDRKPINVIGVTLVGDEKE